MTQKAYLTNLCKRFPEAVFIGSLGTISYDLAEINPKNKILIKGAMGGALSCGLGYAMGAPDKQVFVIIGDGAFLMKMGHIAEVFKHQLENLRVIVLNNNQYKSCGGQKTNFKAFQEGVFFRRAWPFEFVDVD